MSDTSRLGKRMVREYEAMMRRGDWQEGTAEPITVTGPIPDANAPWTLTVTLSGEDYKDAAERTGVLQRWQPGWGEFAVDTQSERNTITLTGNRFTLVQVLDFYPKTWPSAQIALRPAATPEG